MDANKANGSSKVVRPANMLDPDCKECLTILRSREKFHGFKVESAKNLDCDTCYAIKRLVEGN